MSKSDKHSAHFAILVVALLFGAIGAVGTLIAPNALGLWMAIGVLAASVVVVKHSFLSLLARLEK